MKAPDGLDRLVLAVIGAILLALGLYAILRGLGAFGDGSADDPLITGSHRRFLGEHEPWWWLVGALGAVALLIAGVALFRRQAGTLAAGANRSLVRRTPAGCTRVDGGALSAAFEHDLERLPDVDGASVQIERGGTRPVVDVRLDVPDDADVGELRAAVEDHSLGRFRRAVEVDEIVASLHLRLRPREGRALR